MTFLQDSALLEALAARAIRVEPLGLGALQPGSLDLRLGSTIRRFQAQRGLVAGQLPRRLADVSEQQMTLETHPEGSGFIIQPLEFLLAVTLEWITLDDGHIAFVDGCSSIGRAGLLITNAGLVDPGFAGTLTLELFNLAPFPLLLTVGETIGQLTVARMLGRAARPYGAPGLGSRYQGQTVATPSRPPRPKWPIASTPNVAFGGPDGSS